MTGYSLEVAVTHYLFTILEGQMNINRSTIAIAVVAYLIGFSTSLGGITLMNQVRPAPIIITPPEPTPLPEATPTPGLIRVYVNGAVHEAAVYELPPNSLVQQAIEAAGGFKEEANTAIINLAQPLNDGAQIYVPTQGEEVPALIPVTTNQPAPANPTASDAGSNNGLININTASQAELESLPGIGPTTAQNIIAHRDANGPFQTIESVMDVSGIGDGRFNQIKELITVGQ